ncbi:xanthine dehydrogenase family protein molybdopterin-binding subunit [Amycolatopsis jejuensis]|uniref:xanthine dehydrogenase family protein molybdopterin-binding subunit n=1 Tax=Amycolatopsis jejuensis TaxID=330084 RepID=UPI00068C4163|nr:xanthine dehydrogenase family protein molybdopterin-binding subunit [Amycolatopsis jejuensis]
MTDRIAAPGLVGARVRRVEDPRYLTGSGRYVDDLDLPGALTVSLVRSPVARARITGVRLTHSPDLPSGVTLVTGADLGDLAMRAPGAHESWQHGDQPLLAKDVVRFVGEPVAAVLHEDPYLVEDAAEFVEVDYDAQEAIVSLEAALAPDAETVHEHWRDNMFYRRRRVFGDPETGRGQATQVVRRSFRSLRQAGVPLEGRGCAAVPAPQGGRVTLYSSTQVPHLVRTYVARELGIAENSLEVIAPDVGGGFGVKAHVFAEEVLITALALRLGRAVRWTEDRLEHLVASAHARDHVHQLEAHVDDTGKIHFLKAQIVVDAGAYSLFPWTASSDPGMASKVLLGPYAIRNYEVEDRAVATNKCPLGTYRGVGRPSAVYSMERLMDEIARTLVLDPAEVRRANVIREFPYQTANGLTYDPGSYAESLELALKVSGYEEHRARGVEEPDARIRRGYGIALYNEQTSHGTPDFATRGGPIETGYESIRIRVEPDGMVVAYTGLQSHGQSMETTFGQLIAEELGVGLDRVRLVHGDTSASPYCVGTWGSRGAALGGAAAMGAAREIRAKILEIAAHRLEAAVGDLEITDGVVGVKGTDGARVTVAEIAYFANRTVQHLPPGMAPGLEAVSYVDGPPSGTFSNACHVAIADVDTWTGRVSIARYVVVEDCGTIINPAIVDGQVHGGVAQGIGTALLEEMVYSPEGQPESSTFKDYLLPNTSVVPDIEVHHLETPSPWTERGIKGMGESGTIGPMAAVTNAVSDALGLCVAVTPLRPRRVWALLNDGADPDANWQYWTTRPGLASFWHDEEE